MAEHLPDLDDDRLCTVAWSRITEPGDLLAGLLVATFGAAGALRRVLAVAPGGGTGALLGQLREAGVATAGLTGSAVTTALARWSTRLDGLDPRRELRTLATLGGTLVLPGDEAWPAGLADLGRAAPFCLWVRGTLPAAGDRSVAIVGARACTSYGAHVAAELGCGLAESGLVVVSGGAYGIDAAAHRGALAASSGRTVAFLAGGVDRFYPAGNQALLAQVVEQGGAVVSELPPGSVPARQRFLSRNRLIAAQAAGTVVVEAALRSGALATAHRAVDLLRPLGAVPGPVTSMASAGCHALLRSGAATCVTDAAEVRELVGALGVDAVAEPAGEDRRTDALDAVGRRLYDAVPLRRPAPVEAIARTAGLTPRETVAALGQLELAGFAERTTGGWRRTDGP